MNEDAIKIGQRKCCFMITSAVMGHCMVERIQSGKAIDMEKGAQKKTH
jgi:hypothetical protein